MYIYIYIYIDIHQHIQQIFFKYKIGVVHPYSSIDTSAAWLRAILNKSWWQHPTRHQVYGHLPPIMKTIQVRQTRHAGHCWRSRDELLWTLHMAKQKQNDQLEHTYSSYVKIWDVALKTCQRWWMFGRCGERGSGISVLVARHDDDKIGWW